MKALLQQAINDESARWPCTRRTATSSPRRKSTAFISTGFARGPAQSRRRRGPAGRGHRSTTPRANLDYTKIRSPVDGIVINRKIDPGQTLAAQFQTPELFIVAPEMDKKMHVFASVDEADIGLIRRAQEEEQPVEFTVDAYPDDLFTGADRADSLQLDGHAERRDLSGGRRRAEPGPQTAARHDGRPVVPDREEGRRPLRAQRRPAVLSRDRARARERSQDPRRRRRRSPRGRRKPPIFRPSEKAEAGAKRNRRHVWVVEGDKLRAIPIVMGISDSRFTEIEVGRT